MGIKILLAALLAHVLLFSVMHHHSHAQEGFAAGAPSPNKGDVLPGDVGSAVRRQAIEAIDNFAGTSVVISHDRWFLDRVATHILAFEGDSHVEFFDGNFTQYEEDRIRRLGKAAMDPHRIKYKPLTR